MVAETSMRVIRLEATGLAVQNVNRLHRHWAELVGRALGENMAGLDEAVALLFRGLPSIDNRLNL
jgi:hypothetical protein